MSDIAKLLGERIKTLRKERNLSQEDLAIQANINRSFMGEIERGQASATVDSLEKIATALEMTIEDLFKYLQPSYENRENTTLALLMSRINSLSPENQKVILDLIDVALRIKP